VERCWRPGDTGPVISVAAWDEEACWVRRTRSTALVRLAVAVAAAVLVVACSGGGDDDSRGRTTSTVDQEAAVLAAYEAGWRAFEQAAADPVDPNHPALAETMTGPALQAVRQSLGEMAETQQHLEGGVELSPQVTELSGNRAVVEDCVIDRSNRLASNGSLVGRSELTPWPYHAEMVREGGVWRNSQLSRGEATCEP
jgi:hypothetical protein